MRLQAALTIALVLFAAPPAAPSDGAQPLTFPVRASQNSRYLIDADGTPLLVHGDAAWSLMTELTPPEVDEYIADRRRRGFNAVIVNLIERFFGDDAPRTVNGLEPFSPHGDFSGRNDDYFAHADWVLSRFREAKLLVFLFPAYLGYEGGEEGWFHEMNALTPGQCREYGQFLGGRYGHLENIVWVLGGDFAPPSWSPARWCTLALGLGLREADSDALMTAHWDPNTDSLSQSFVSQFVFLNGVYTYRQTAGGCRASREAHAEVPTLLFEGRYESEWDALSDRIRRQSYWGVLACGAGHIYGNGPVWRYADGWREALDSIGARDVAHAQALFEQVAWFDLQPDDRLVRRAIGRPDDSVVAASTPDGTLAIVYVATLPRVVRSTGPRRVTLVLDLGHMSSAVRIRFYDPTTGTFGGPIDRPATGGPVEVSTPGDNANGDTDWVLVLDVEA